MKALDTSIETVGQAQQIVAGGYGAVGIYLRPDRCSLAMISELRAAGLQIWSIYEKGFPIRDSYFTPSQGTIDGHAAAAFANGTLNQPSGSCIYAAVDYDPDHNSVAGPTIAGPIRDYFNFFSAPVTAAGYSVGVYGSGRTCRILTSSGVASAGWLCQSTSFAESTTYAPHAAIVQLPSLTSNWDEDRIQNSAVAGLW